MAFVQQQLQLNYNRPEAAYVYVAISNLITLFLLRKYKASYNCLQIQLMSLTDYNKELENHCVFSDVAV